jgi:hypothetical protein
MTRRPFAVLAALSLGLLAVRLYAASRIGFGDSEALYACWALHPQPAYLDHPGLVGVVARLIGSGGAPSPQAAHVFTALAATLAPLVGAAAARAAGATWERAAVCAIALVAAPELTVGLFGLTPDLLLAFAWLGTLACAAYGLRAEPGSVRAAVAFLGAGLLAGIGVTAKVTALPLVAALIVTYASTHARPHARTLWPWAGLALGLLVVLPVVSFEARTGWPMLRHRLVDTQEGAGVSLRNAGAIVVGQLAYLSPLLAWLAYLVGRAVWRTRDEDAVGRLLAWSFALPLAVLLPLALWSRVAEPHWLAPPLLALPIAWARAPGVLFRRALGVAACATGLAMSAIAHAWVLVPAIAGALPASFDTRMDIATELYGWPDVIREVKSLPLPSGAEEAVIVGPHWVVCAQLHAALGPKVAVGCATPIPDDFDAWRPRAEWQRADTVLYVTDTRFEVEPARLFPDRTPVAGRTVTIRRGGRVVRVFTLLVLEKSGLGAL